MAKATNNRLDDAGIPHRCSSSYALATEGPGRLVGLRALQVSRSRPSEPKAKAVSIANVKHRHRVNISSHRSRALSQVTARRLSSV